MFVLAAACGWMLFGRSAIGQEEAAPEQKLAESLGLNIFSIKEYGPTATPAETKAAFDKALQALTAAEGGILVVPEDVPSNVDLENNARWSHSVDPTSSSLKDWKVGPGVLVIDNREGNFVLRVPAVGKANNAGITLDRTLRLPKGDSLTHWTEESILNLENQVVHGTCNYMEWIVEPVKAGEDARFYVPTARNLFEGMFLNLHQGPGYAGQVARATVKKIGWDPDKKLHYFTAFTPYDHKAGAIVQNKSHVPALRIVNHVNAANQTFFLYNKLKQYANGDSYLFEATFDYMGNVHSMPGDENGNCYAALIHSMTDIFQGTVKALEPEAPALVYKGGRNANALANSRPLINLNTNKWLTQGSVIVVPPGNPAAPNEMLISDKWVYDGKSYPTRLEKNPKTGVNELIVGGLIRGGKDCPWDESIVGRFFAVDEESEYVTGRKVRGALRRWYEIASLTVNDDGTKDIQIKRYWWGAKAWNSPTLYDPQNYSRDGNVKPLAYVIAPGAYVNDVSEAVGAPHQSGGVPPYRIGLTPYPDMGTAFDFAADDSVEQAMGADPFKPQGLRIWGFDAVPGAWPSALIDLGNNGKVARASAVTVHGGPTTLEGCEQRKERRPAFDRAFWINTAATVGLDCSADFADAAILFRQPNHEQPIKWHYGAEENREPKEAQLTVSKDNGDFTLEGGDLRLSGGVVTKGISGDGQAARNLRGKNVPVKSGATSVDIAFPAAEADGDYAVFVEQNWIVNRAIVKKTAAGFSVLFADPAPADATLDWFIVR